jgi:prepilin-type N-terminal cleavage/methylation domain-containing protein
MNEIRKPHGFTLIELLVAMAIIGVLAAIAVPLYRVYIVKADVADYLANYDTLKTQTALFYEAEGDCNKVLTALAPAALASPHVALNVGFENVGKGFAPYLRFCAEISRHGGLGIRVAKAAHDAFAEMGLMGKGAVLGASMVAFAVPLVPDATPVCTDNRYTPALGTGCGAQLQTGLTPTLPTVQAPPKPQAPAGPMPQPIKVPKLQAYVMKFSGTDTYVRPAGEKLDTDGPLDAFTMEMSFIGDTSIAAASGGSGPVMFNYGDGSNAHNAISLWNPKSLTVALLNQNFDSGVNVADGQTHRISTTWDSATGRLAILDNGVVVKSWNNVHTGATIPGNGHMVIAHKSTGGGAYNAGEAFAGQIFNTAIARGAVSDADLADPLNQVVDTGSGLLADFQAAGGTVVDATGRHTVESGGMTPTLTGVEGNLVKQP